MKKGDPDLFLCQSCTAPSQSRSHDRHVIPYTLSHDDHMIHRYTWCSQEVGHSCINLTTDDKEYDIEKVWLENQNYS